MRSPSPIRAGASSIPRQIMPRLYIIAGCNGSGKTTASYKELPELLDCTEFVNSDEFAKALSPSNPDAASIMAGRYMLMKIQRLLSRRVDFCIESTLATRSLLQMIRSSKEMGYTVSILYLWVSSPELARQRVRARVAAGGHNVKDETIQRRYEAGLKNFFGIYLPECDHWTLADNSNPPFRLIAEGGRKGITVHDPQLYETISKDYT